MITESEVKSVQLSVLEHVRPFQAFQNFSPARCRPRSNTEGVAFSNPRPHPHLRHLIATYQLYFKPRVRLKMLRGSQALSARYKSKSQSNVDTILFEQVSRSSIYELTKAEDTSLACSSRTARFAWGVGSKVSTKTSIGVIRPDR